MDSKQTTDQVKWFYNFYHQTLLTKLTIVLISLQFFPWRSIKRQDPSDTATAIIYAGTDVL